jgi:GTPase involved in cell partitioning and DNA repair
MGRGGAGNWYQPTELEKEGNFTTSGDATSAPTASRPNISTPWHPEDQELPVARAGRGGAGNFVWKDEEKERKRIEDEEAARGKLSEKVEHDVEQGLAKPGAAVLGGVKGGRGW